MRGGRLGCRTHARTHLAVCAAPCRVLERYLRQGTRVSGDPVPRELSAPARSSPAANYFKCYCDSDLCNAICSPPIVVGGGTGRARCGKKIRRPDGCPTSAARRGGPFERHVPNRKNRSGVLSRIVMDNPRTGSDSRRLTYNLHKK